MKMAEFATDPSLIAISPLGGAGCPDRRALWSFASSLSRLRFVLPPLYKHTSLFPTSPQDSPGDSPASGLQVIRENLRIRMIFAAPTFGNPAGNLPSVLPHAIRNTTVNPEAEDLD
jgi:hypothetical protein